MDFAYKIKLTKSSLKCLMDLKYLFTGTYTGTSWNVTFCHDYSPLIHFQILFHFSVSSISLHLKGIYHWAT